MDARQKVRDAYETLKEFNMTKKHEELEGDFSCLFFMVSNFPLNYTHRA